MGSKDQDLVSRATKERHGEVKVCRLHRTYSSSRAREQKGQGDRGRVQLLRTWGVRVWACPVGSREAGEMDQQPRGLAALCRGPESGF